MIGSLELAELATNLLEELPGGETDGATNAKVALKEALASFYEDLTFNQAVQRRDSALGEAYEMALATHDRINVWKNGREYVCRVDGEYLAMVKKPGWLFVATVEVRI